MTQTPLIDPASTQDIKPGAIFEVVHPFIRAEVSLFDETEGKSVVVESWLPGTRAEFVLPDGPQAVAYAEGFQILEVVSLHKPGKYPTRVFYLRRWRDPSGHEFGKGELRCKSLSAFRRLIGGYRWPYAIEKKRGHCGRIEVLKHVSDRPRLGKDDRGGNCQRLFDSSNPQA